jgi:peptidoglycan/xylan/chitin deacetylase (PgdA/CDA1 family)
MSHDAFAIPVLTYHSMRVDGNDYASNDHVALREDLKMLDRLGWVVRPLDVLVVEVFESPSCKPNNPKSIAIAFDDGSDFDAKALKHPTYGTQQSMLSILQDFASSSGQQTVHATSFVIVSPDARKELEGTCMAGLPWWNDDWWGAAIQTGLMSIGNHSWDHNHDTLKHRASGTAGGRVSSATSCAICI